MDRWRRWRLLLAVVAALALALGVAATALVRSQERSRDELADRFALRGGLGARFAESFVAELLAAERRRARAELAGRVVGRAQFERVVEAFGFQAALLLDARGRVIHVTPHEERLVGTRLAGRYEHLRAAVAGKTTVSNVVSSAAEGIPIVAFAVPFGSETGERRVFSGAFALARTPLAAYLRNALPLEHGRIYVVDGENEVVVASLGARSRYGRLDTVDPALADAMRTSGRGTTSDPAGERYFVVERVRLTPWRLVASAPSAELFEPIGGFARWAPWLLFAAFALACLIAAALFVRLVEQRGRLARANAALAETNVELEKADRMKDEFLALVSHELRTPLTSVIGYLSLLLRGRVGPLEPEQRRVVEIAERNASRLVRLVSDLLFSAKADAGKLELERGLVGLDEIVSRSVEAAEPAARERGVALASAVEPGIVVDADRARIMQVVDNLVSNAVKFTPEGGTVAVDLWTQTGDAVVEVRDSGIGIPQDEIDRLFDRFFRASTAVEREIQGSGLGLSVAKTIVDAHGGTIGCTSVAGEGSVFRVALPLAVVEAAA